MAEFIVIGFCVSADDGGTRGEGCDFVEYVDDFEDSAEDDDADWDDAGDAWSVWDLFLILRSVSADLHRAAVETLLARALVFCSGSIGGGSVIMDEEWLVTLTSFWNSTLRLYWVLDRGVRRIRPSSSKPVGVMARSMVRASSSHFSLGFLL